MFVFQSSDNVFGLLQGQINTTSKDITKMFYNTWLQSTNYIHNHWNIVYHYKPNGYEQNLLIHSGLVMPYGDKDLGNHWLRYWLVAWWLQAITRTNVDLS